MIHAQITDPKDNHIAYVDDQNGLIVSVASCPPLIPQKNKIYSQKLQTSAGSDDMGIDADAVGNTEFYISADNDNDIYITYLSFIMGYGSSADLHEFADSTAALSNGVRVYYSNNEGVETTIMNPKSNYSFMRSFCRW